MPQLNQCSAAATAAGDSCGYFGSLQLGWQGLPHQALAASQWPFKPPPKLCSLSAALLEAGT